MSFWGQLSLIDAASPLQSEMFLFHDHAMVLLLGIFVFVATLGCKLVMNSLTSRTMFEAQRLETVWTIVPALLLIWLALPSLRLLYLLDERSNSGIILKATGHQWYWSYEIPFSDKGSFDSYMVPENDLNEGDFRLLEVDNRTVVPYGMETTVIATSADVLHAWTLPAMGVKMDAVPGRLNSMSMFVEKPGVFYGQCSEICGANHSFMPIVVETMGLEDFCSLEF
uniref:Cytochrome c oxidase subunit 2 n=4 Tax=Chromodoris TaxID=71297 RepID=A0A343RAP1_9GAST|nr:cytochrome c oxidase subunit II [Chromodoris magnifica]YP_009250330.1 cytochrome c oxidase subunit II [Chromodoris quadricolor]YP_009445821.1 cytochrome c oxidase subunit II [Chromodoris annae]YP_009566685.1 cytochrome c oxidase subunit II [Chromodoris orientalis]YP_010930448.1 cytochrome c oxidase subunit II [Chromodoris lochi]YP_010960277.1 cytochrome c oxidase subunit II [Chromodoris elisabethina]YP_010968168.1 cytochrome c oxidase subunit II [Chromodoris colemani]ABK92235.1 cytochrome